MSKNLILVLSVLVQAAIALSRYIPAVGSYFSSLSPTAALGAQLSVIGVHFTLLTGSLVILFAKESAERAQSDKAMLEKIQGAVVRPLRATQFYSDFAAAIRSAAHNVNICYFAVVAPDATYDPERKSYYESLPGIVRAHPNVAFRRLVRKTPSNLSWLAGQVEIYGGVHNVSLAYVNDAPRSEPMGLALSTQIVDSEHVWFVAVESHEREGKYRDLYVQDRELGGAFSKYFDRLWRQSTVVLEWGTVTKDGQELLSKDATSEAEAP